MKESSRLLGVVIIFVITGVIGIIANYFLLVPLSVHAPVSWGFVFFLIGIPCFLSFCIRNKKLFKILLILLIVYTATWIGISIAGSKLLNSNSYVNLIEVTEGSFEEDVVEASSDDIISVDVLTASKLGDRTISNISNSTLYEVDDEYNLIEYNGEWYRISPLNYGGLFKYFKAKDVGIPGYVLVNAKTSEATLVQLEEGGIKYSPSAYFSYDLSRHLRKQYPSYNFATSFFEIDEDGTPYWITGVYQAKIGLKSGLMIESAVITNAITGESTEYSLDELPSWVDHVESISYLMERIYWHYEYVNGVINFSKNGVYRTSYYYKDSNEEDEENEYTPFDGYSSVVSKDGELYFYTGVTPANSSESNVGFLLISPRTGEVRYYSSTGAEESSAQAAAEGLVQNLRYSASFPTVVNVDGIETYFMTLKDDAGLVQRYALCNVANYSIVVEGSTIEEAIEAYRTEMGLEASDTSETETESVTEAEEYEVTFVVENLAEVQIDGYTYFVITSQDENDGCVYLSSIENSYLQAVKLTEGSGITVKYYNSSSEDYVKIITEIYFGD